MWCILPLFLDYIEQIAARDADPAKRLKTVSNETRDILNELQAITFKETEAKSKDKQVPDKFNSVSLIFVIFLLLYDSPPSFCGK